MPTIGDLIPNLQQVFASSTPISVQLFAYLWPVVPFVFAIVAVTAVVGLVIGMFYWLGHKISNFFHRKKESKHYRNYVGESGIGEGEEY